MDRLESRGDLFLQKLPGHSVHDFRHPMESTRLSGELNKTVDWSEGDGRGLYADESASHIEARILYYSRSRLRTLICF